MRLICALARLDRRRLPLSFSSAWGEDEEELDDDDDDAAPAPPAAEIELRFKSLSPSLGLLDKSLRLEEAAGAWPACLVGLLAELAAADPTCLSLTLVLGVLLGRGDPSAEDLLASASSFVGAGRFFALGRAFVDSDVGAAFLKKEYRVPFMIRTQSLRVAFFKQRAREGLVVFR